MEKIKSGFSKKEKSYLNQKKIIYAARACENKQHYTHHWRLYFEKIFKNIIYFDPQKKIYQLGKKSMIKNLYQLIKKEKPDYLFLYLNYHDDILPHELIRIKEFSPKTKIINYADDDDNEFHDAAIFYNLIFDHYLVFPELPLPEYKKYGLKNVFPTTQLNTENFKPLNLGKKYDVSFVGVLKEDRYEMIKFLKDNGISVRVYGGGWHKFPELKKNYGGPIGQEEFVKVINQSKINLNFTKNYEGNPHLKYRVLEVGACKSFCLSEYFGRYYEFFRKGEIEMFRDKKELLEKIKYYLKEDKKREKISNAAYKRIMEDHRFDKELENFFKEVLKSEDKEPTKLSKLNKRICTLSKRDFKKGKKFLDIKTKNCDYITFKTKGARPNKYKNYFQAYSLLKLKKEISCCNYYVHSSVLGDYLLFYAKQANKKLPRRTFSKLINPNQLMVTKDFFEKHHSLLEHAMGGKKIDFVNSKNTAFVSIPLVTVNKIKPVDYTSMKKAFGFKFQEYLYPLVFQKKLFSNPYPYRLVLNSLLTGKGYILKFIYDSIFVNKDKAKTFQKIYSNNLRTYD